MNKQITQYPLLEKFKNKYRIQTNRLQGFDCGSRGMYFVTICTKDRIHFFGEIVETGNCPSPEQSDNYPPSDKPHNCAALRATEIGNIAQQFWMEIPQHYPFVILDEFVIMPNHIHGILFFDKPDKSDWTPNSFGVQSQNLGAVIRAYKSSVKRFANQNEIKFAWHSRFHDHIIRDEREYTAIKNYIINNLQNWEEDKLNDNIR